MAFAPSRSVLLGRRVAGGRRPQSVRRCNSFLDIPRRSHTLIRASRANLRCMASTEGVFQMFTRKLRLSRKATRLLAAGIAAVVIGGGAAGIVASSSGSGAATAATSVSATSGQHVPGGGSNARYGPAAGGSVGTVESVSGSGFTLATSAGQKVTVNEAPSTSYQKGTSSSSASAITKGELVLVLGTTNGTTITASQATLQPAGTGPTSSSSAGVVPFNRA